MSRVSDDPGWARRCRRIAESPVFQRAMLGVIVVAAAISGIETYPSVVEEHEALFFVLDALVLTTFTIEIIIRLAAYGRRPWRFFLDPWNVFDFLIVVVCLAPLGANQAAAARLVRLMRVFRLFSGIGRLKLIVTAMARAIPSIGYVSLLLFLLFYVYAILGTTLFRHNDPVHFGTLHSAMLSLLRTVTLEDWTDLMYIQIYGSDVYGYESAAQKLSDEQESLWQPRAMPLLGAAYFVTFVLIGTMIILNLFVGVVLSSLNDAQASQAREVILKSRRNQNLDGRLAQLETMMTEMHEHVRALREETQQGIHSRGGQG